jgi:hypothetical protein
MAKAIVAIIMIAGIISNALGSKYIYTQLGK